jgi:isochorismate synthase
VISKLTRLINLCLEKNIPFVSFRLPGRTSIYTWVQLSGRIIFAESVNEIIDKHGFLYAPFHRRTNLPVVFFEPELIIKNFDIPESIINKIAGLSPLYPGSSEQVSMQVSKEEYLQKATGLIKLCQGDLKKAVLSRNQLVKKIPGFDAGNFFIRLQDKYPSAFCHLIHIPGAGTWTGASPETLLRIDERYAKTVSLAGTQVKPVDSKEIRWNEKEMEEQRLVTDFIIQILNQFKIKDYQIEGPQTIEAGNAIHIATSFIFDRTYLKNRMGEFLEQLHPTPAVCGIPKERALELILQTENHNREYYSGYCGLFNVKDRTDLFVNLRCMKILDQSFVLYVGGGITAKSVPKKEWEETELKSQTLLSIILKS